MEERWRRKRREKRKKKEEEEVEEGTWEGWRGGEGGGRGKRDRFRSRKHQEECLKQGAQPMMSEEGDHMKERRS